MDSRLTISSTCQESLLTGSFDVLVFQKVFDAGAITFALKARDRGIKTIFLISDQHESEMARVVDQVVVTSNYLKKFFDTRYGIDSVVIEDAIEVPTHLEKTHVPNSNITLVWVGHSDNWASLQIVRDVLINLRGAGFTLKTISNHNECDVPWSLETVFNEILSCDIAVIPASSTHWSKSKSNNRLTMFMALGMPVVASGVPSYRTIIKHGRNGFLAENETQWLECLGQLKDEKIRARIGGQARKDVLSTYTMDFIGQRWVSLFNRLL